MRISLITILTCLSLNKGFAQLVIEPVDNAASLISYLQGFGLEISNMEINAAPNSIGFFEGSSPMAFGSGVILSTGKIDSLNNPRSYFSSHNNEFPGDIHLDAISTFPTFDACVIEFDCVPSNQNLQFDFAFGSEEYNDFVNSQYNDVFAILVSGRKPSGGYYVNQNLAIVPNSNNVPITINTINNGYSGVYSASNGPCSHCEYFLDNFNGESVSYDGFTVGLSSLIPVIPHESYHFKIAIADASDEVYDSGVMFLTNSFRSFGSNPIIENDTTQSIISSTTTIYIENNYVIYPQPAKDKIIVQNTVPIQEIEILDILGKKQNFTYRYKHNNAELTLENISAGVYFLSIKAQNKKTIKKIIIE